MKKVTSKQIFMGVLVAGVALCLLVYLLVFTKYNDMTAALEKSNADLQTQADELKGYYDNMQQYRSDTAQMAKGVNDMTLDYPSNAEEEDALMMAVDMQEVAIINYDKINIDPAEVIHTVAKDVVDVAKVDGVTEQIDFVKRQATYSNVTNYAELKKAVAKIYESPYRIGINSIAYKKDSELNNFITGTIDVNFFSVTGMNKEYEYPDMAEYIKGTRELFGPLVYISEDAAAQAGSEAEETAEN